ncbi:MAG: class I SAM-dependent methyltransferase [Xanthomonadales bacterium]|nr:class I SAM-dependent methyltransferase [Xanthomonadales bacterium]
MMASAISDWIRSRPRVYSWRAPEEIQSDCYRAVSDLDSVKAYFRGHSHAPATGLLEGDAVDGECYVCGGQREFRVTATPGGGDINWRETLVCQSCGLMNRWRNCIHLFEALLRPTESDRIYITEQVTPLYEALALRYPSLTGSEYSTDLPMGEVSRLGAQDVRIEDVTSLSFPERHFEVVLSFDVLEHVPDFPAALKEFFRVLKAGGQLLLTVPFNFGADNRVRARLDGNGEVEHLMPPQYHGDPLSAEGVLCFQDFGVELVKNMHTAGFQDAFMVCSHSRRWVYPGPHIAFVGRKRA